MLIGCGGSADHSQGDGQGAPPSVPTGALTVALAGKPTSIDPTLGFSLAELTIVSNIYEGLVTFDERYQLTPSLATAWNVSPDAREWTFTLREGVRFHDGTMLDGAAVKKSFEYYARKGSGYSFAVGSIASIDAPDSRTVKVRYKEPFPDLARNCTLIRVLSPKLLAGGDAEVAKRVAERPVGTGPFQFSSQQSGGTIATRAFGGYWGDGPYLETLSFKVIPDETGRISALQAGDVDVVMQLPPLAARTLGSDERRKLSTVPSWTTVIMDMRSDRGPFADVRVRQALAYALDRKALVDKVLFGQARLDNAIMPPGVYGYREPATTYAYDPDKARALVREASAGGAIRARLAISSEAVLAGEIADAIAAQLTAVGLTTSVDVLDNALANKDLFVPNRKYDLHILELGWVNGGPLHFSLGSINGPSRYSGKELLDAMKRMNSLPDGAARAQAIGDAIDVIARDVPVLTMWVPNRIDAVKRSLQGYEAPRNVFSQFGKSYLAS
jgi:peptide/nickel transport system substrate-binding protein